MKYFIIFLILLFGLDKNCPSSGDSANPKLQALDQLKNRSSEPNIKPTEINLSDILAKGEDSQRFNSNQYISTIGYIYLVKRGGSETCNCHRKNKQDLDVHIELLTSMNDNPKRSMICEINRYTIAANKNMSFENIKKLQGKKVKITGFLFSDEEHKQNAINTNPSGTDIWRGTIWEVHPVFKIEAI